MPLKSRQHFGNPSVKVLSKVASFRFVTLFKMNSFIDMFYDCKKYKLSLFIFVFKFTNSSYVCVSEGKKCSFLGKFGVLCFLGTPVLRFALLLYYRRSLKNDAFELLSAPPHTNGGIN